MREKFRFQKREPLSEQITLKAPKEFLDEMDRLGLHGEERAQWLRWTIGVALRREAKKRES